MTDPIDILLLRLTGEGVSIATDNHDLLVEASENVLTEELIETLRKRKQEILSHLSAYDGRPAQGRRDAFTPVALRCRGGLLTRRPRSQYSKTGCRYCGSSDYRDTPIHYGESTRRDCAHCDRYIGFVRWYGKQLEI
jgi:hypothetical protein